MDTEQSNLKLMACKALVRYSVDSEDYYPNIHISLSSVKDIFPLLKQFGPNFDETLLHTLLYGPDVLKHEVLLLHGRFKGNLHHTLYF